MLSFFIDFKNIIIKSLSQPFTETLLKHHRNILDKKQQNHSAQDVKILKINSDKNTIKLLSEEVDKLKKENEALRAIKLSPSFKLLVQTCLGLIFLGILGSSLGALLIKGSPLGETQKMFLDNCSRLIYMPLSTLIGLAGGKALK